MSRTQPRMSRGSFFASIALVGATALTLLALAGCGKTDGTAKAQTSAVKPQVAIPFKIGIMTGTVSQGEDEFRAGQMVVAKYGADHVKMVTYPDNFMQEQETVISQLVGLSSDPDVKVIVVGQAVPGTVAAVRKIREKRPDILIGMIEAHEDPDIVNATADISIQPDQLARGRTIVDVAHKMGVTDLVHYSFPRHMSMELLARRRDIMKQACAADGIKFHFVTAPDPMGEGGLPATQQFVMEDVPRELKQYGPKTAFFSTNCGMMDPMIRTVLNGGGYVPEQCCPSPTHGYPTALGIAIPPDKAGDFAYINAENKRRSRGDALDPRGHRSVGRRRREEGELQGSRHREGIDGGARGRPDHAYQIRREEGELLPLPCQQHLLLAAH